MNLAAALATKGDLALAEAIARSAVGTLESVQEELQLAMAHHALAVVLQDRKKFAEAKTHLQRAVPVYRTHGRVSELAMVHHTEGSLALEAGHPAEAAAAAVQAEEIFQRLGNALYGANCRWL